MKEIIPTVPLRGAVGDEAISYRLLRRPSASSQWNSRSLGFAMIAILVLIFSGCNQHAKENKACFKGNCYVVELAISDEERMKGLQNRDVLEKNKGMLFALVGNVPEKFWMKKTLIPLDILWLDYAGQIIFIEHAAVPCEKDPCPVYGPAVPASYVLEINAGEAARLDMRVGDRITLELKNVNQK